MATRCQEGSKKEIEERKSARDKHKDGDEKKKADVDDGDDEVF